jgi:CheY-like chemotaxis protein
VFFSRFLMLTRLAISTASPVKTILVIEDDDDVRARWGAALSEDGYRVAMVPSALEALDYLREYPARTLLSWIC